MMETIGNNVRPIDRGEFARWFGRAHEPWSPIMAAERQLAALSAVTETPPVLAAYDHLYEMASQAVRWLELNSCPDKETGETTRGPDDGLSDCGRHGAIHLLGKRDARSINGRTFDS